MALEINFIEKLMEARKKARLQGRPLTRKETSGIVSGVAETATDRLALAEQLRLQRKAFRLEKKKYEREQPTRGERLAGVVDPIGSSIGANWPAKVHKNLGCIIISACTHPQSYEVNVARFYRDWVLDETTLTGYYLIGQWLAPFIYRHRAVKWFFKKYLVDRLIDYAETVFWLEPGYAFKSSKPIATGFLKICELAGRFTNWILRRY